MLLCATLQPDISCLYQLQFQRSENTLLFHITKRPLFKLTELSSLIHYFEFIHGASLHHCVAYHQCVLLHLVALPQIACGKFFLSTHLFPLCQSLFDQWKCIKCCVKWFFNINSLLLTNFCFFPFVYNSTNNFNKRHTVN